MEWSVLQMVSEDVSHMGSSRQTRDLERFVERKSIPWNLPTNFQPDLIAAIRQRCLPLLCALLPISNPICFWSVWCRRTMIPGKIFTSFAKFQRVVSVNDLSFLSGSQNFCKFLLCFLRSFCFARIRLDPFVWPSPAPRLHIDDCFENHNLRSELCDLL